MTALALYAFYGILLAIGALVAVIAVDAARRAIRRREAFKRLAAGAATSGQPAHGSLIRATVAPDRHDPLGRIEAHVKTLFLQSGGAYKPPILIAAAVVAGALGFLIGERGFGSILISAVLGIILAVVIPYVMLLHGRERRRNAFITQLPAAMDILVRSLRAGHPLTVAVSMAGRDMPSPSAEEFSICANEMTYGLDLQTAIYNVAARVGAPEASVMASAIAIQQRTGGNLTEVLQRLATLLRERAKLRAKARALSAEGRYSGMFLSALPFLMFAGLTLANPNYYGGVQDNPLVPIVLGVTLFWMGVGILIIQRMVNFKP